MNPPATRRLGKMTAMRLMAVAYMISNGEDVQEYTSDSSLEHTRARINEYVQIIINSPTDRDRLLEHGDDYLVLRADNKARVRLTILPAARVNDNTPMQNKL